MRIDEVAHWSGVVPLAAVAIAWALSLGTRLRPPSEAHWWVAFGLAVSVFADSVQRLVGGTFDVTFYYVPAQIALVLWAFERGLIVRVLILAFLAVAGWVSAQVTEAPAEWMIALVGGMTICAAAWKAGVLRAPLWVYFGLGTLAYLWLIPTIGTEAIYPRWLAYQSCRWAAFALFALDVARHSRRPGWT